MEIINWRPRLWKEGTRSLSMIERAVYFELINEMYLQGGPILDDRRYLAGLCGCNLRTLNQAVNRLVEIGKIERQIVPNLSSTRHEVGIKSLSTFLQKDPNRA